MYGVDPILTTFWVQQTYHILIFLFEATVLFELILCRIAACEDLYKSFHLILIQQNHDN
jgi:hypothetical protein